MCPGLGGRHADRRFVATDLLLHVSEEARRQKPADKRLFGHQSLGTRYSGGDASDSGRHARDLRRVLTVTPSRAAGGRSETVDLRPRSDRRRDRPGQVRRTRTSTGNTSGYPFQYGVRPNSSDADFPALRRFRRPVDQTVRNCRRSRDDWSLSVLTRPALRSRPDRSLTARW